MMGHGAPGFKISLPFRMPLGLCIHLFELCMHTYAVLNSDIERLSLALG